MPSRSVFVRAAIATLAGAACLLIASSADATAPVKLTAADAETSDFFGASVAISGDTAIVGAQGGDDAGTDSGSAYIYRWNGTGWTQEAKLVASDAAAGDIFGVSVAIDGDTAIVGAFAADGPAGVDQGSAYIFTRSGSTWTQQDKLTAADGAPSDWFGRSVALSGGTAIVGAMRDDNAAGSAYVFTRSGTTWTQQDKLTAADAATGDQFGRSVALSGDTAFVGAWQDDDAGTNSGSAYVFTRSGTTWTQQAKLTAPDAATFDYFGGSVAISGDAAIVGAEGDDDAGTDSGSAYAFTRSGSTWTLQNKLTAGDAAPSAFFGAAVAMSGDTAIVGAPYDDAAVVDSGSAYVFARQTWGWVERAKLAAPGGASDDFFGYAVAVFGDTVIIGAEGDDPQEQDDGSAHVFERIGPVWVGPDMKVVAADAAADDWFGYSVALFGDTAIVGARYDDGPAGISQGSAYIFTHSGGTWTQQAKLTASDAAAFDNFGISVALGYNMAIVGAHRDDDAGTDSGSAYFFTRSGSTWTQQAKLTAADAAGGDEFGYAVALSDLTAIVGAYLDDDAGSNSGSAYIYRWNGSGWTEEAKLTAADAAAGDWFGYSVALAGDTAIVGAYLDDDAGSASGSAYVFTRGDTTWTQQAKLTASDASADDNFGFSVALSADSALVGAHYADGSDDSSGSAYVFTRSGSTWTQQAKLTAANGGANDYFGISVALSGDTAIVGATGDDNAGTDSGSAYVFVRNGSTWAQQTKLTAADGKAGDNFGRSVALNSALFFNATRDTAIVGASRDDGPPGVDPDDPDIDHGSAWFFNVAADSFPVVFNTTAGSGHTSFGEAFAGAAAFDSMRATPVAFRVESPIDPMLTPVTVGSSGDIRVPYGSTMTVGAGSLFAAAPGKPVNLYGPAVVGSDGALFSGSSMLIANTMTLLGGTMHASTARITGAFSGFGDITAATTNDGDAIVQADLQIIGDYTNNGVTTIQNGTLTILGALTDNGTIIGDFAATRATGGFFVENDYAARSSATLTLLGGAAKFGSNADIAINSNTRYDMATSELRMVGLAGTVQTLERMSKDIGPSPDGLDRTLPGHYPIDTLRIGPTATTVNLVDNHDNDNLGQAQCEAIYARTLIIDAGATLNTNGCPVYYETLINNGTVDDSANLIQIAQCTADLTGDGLVNGADLGLLLGSWGTAQGDLTGDGNTDGADLGLLLGAWGVCP